MITIQNVRMVFIGILIITGITLFNVWQEEHPAAPQVPEKPAAIVHHDDIPEVHAGAVVPQASEPEAVVSANQISVETDLFRLAIDLRGGDIVQAELPGYQNYALFNREKERFYIAQSGLSSVRGPDIAGHGRGEFTGSEKHAVLDPHKNTLTVDLHKKTADGLLVTKRFHFTRGSYAIQVSYLIDNQSAEPYQGHFFTRLKRKEAAGSGGGFLGVQTFTGAAINTPETPYKKLSFKDIEEKPIDRTLQGGWVAMVEHYFVGAWIPAITTEQYVYQAKKMEDGTYGVGWRSEEMLRVLPGQQGQVGAVLYAGPQITEILEKLAPGLEHTVDYGILWPVCQPIFSLLKMIQKLLGNWGWSIILITIIIKGAFYKLSASSYRSMGNLRKIQPLMDALKVRCGDDKQKLGQEMIQLYRREKINPLGGCLPILIQIPVFISLYYVLLGSVELRHAPFMGWISDLSAKDPYYVLPLIMGVTMFIQQKLSPAPPDPIQAKMMMFMPVIFTVLFAQFPSGLVLYWVVNNSLSITQQWFIMRRLDNKKSRNRIGGAHC
jgi:YidC/Oxa1 family membrane protein insertase